MDKLPLEILVHILSFVPPSERLYSALTCRRWAQAVSTPELLKDVRLTIHGRDQLQSAEAVLMRSRREYMNLKLSGVHLTEYDAGFWAEIGRDLCELELDRCTCSPQVLVEILRACSELGCLNVSKLEFESESSGNFHWEEIQEPFNSVRQVHPPAELTRTEFANMLRLMPNVGSVSFSAYVLETEFVEYLPSLLGANRLLTELNARYLLPAHRMAITDGELEEWTKLIRFCSAGVEVLRIDRWLPSETHDAIGDCTNLRHLTIAEGYWLVDDQMKKILLNNPGLESLDVRSCSKITDEGFAPLHQLKKLRKLSFRSCGDTLTNGFLRSLGTIPSLQDVEFETKAPNSRASFLESIASLRNLRALNVHSAPLDSGCLKVVLEDFKNLRALTLFPCQKLTESDFVKLRHFKQLRSLELILGKQLTDFAVEEGLGSPALESLVLTGCPLTDHGLASISAHHGHLRTFTISPCKNITSAGLIVLLHREPLLKRLSIRGTALTHEFFEALEELCPQLRHLECRFDSSVSDSVLESFRTRRPAVCIKQV